MPTHYSRATPCLPVLQLLLFPISDSAPHCAQLPRARPVSTTLNQPTGKTVFEFLLACGPQCPGESQSYLPGCSERASSLNGMVQLWFFPLPRSLCLGNTGGAVGLWKCLNKVLQSSLEHFLLFKTEFLKACSFWNFHSQGYLQSFVERRFLKNRISQSSNNKQQQPHQMSVLWPHNLHGDS